LPTLRKLEDFIEIIPEPIDNPAYQLALAKMRQKKNQTKNKRGRTLYKCTIGKCKVLSEGDTKAKEHICAHLKLLRHRCEDCVYECIRMGSMKMHINSEHLGTNS
jgi:hypothetical protein